MRVSLPPVVETEKGFQAAVIELASLHRWKVYWTWNSLHSPKGFPDLVLGREGRPGTPRPGELIIAELKSVRGKVSAAQQEWLDLLATVPYIEVYLWKPHDWPTIEARLTRR
jgi:hypothetical protein